jgi:GTPase SAR1 family protein
MYYRGENGALVVYDSSQPRTLKAVKGWIEGISFRALKKIFFLITSELHEKVGYDVGIVLSSTLGLPSFFFSFQ